MNSFITSTKRQAIAFILLRLVKEFTFWSNSKRHTQCALKNMKVKAPSEYHNESTQPKGSIPRTCPKSFSGIRKNLGDCKENAHDEVHS